MTLLQSTQEAEKEILQVLLWLTQAALCCIIISLLYIRNQHIIHSANTTHNVANERGKTKGKNPPLYCRFFLLRYDVRGERPPAMTY